MGAIGSWPRFAPRSRRARRERSQSGPAKSRLPYSSRRSAVRRNPRDPFGSFFDDPFFGNALGERRRLKVVAPAIELDVKPLPAEGRPLDFSGAVGLFKFTADGSPNKVKMGDPVTMKLKVTGNGNFDRMQPPAMIDPTGWHAYPAADDFQAADDLKMTGTKTFEMPVVPERPQKHMPQFRFTFFNPNKGKYETQESPPIALVVEGSPPPAPASSAASGCG